MQLKRQIELLAKARGGAGTASDRRGAADGWLGRYHIARVPVSAPRREKEMRSPAPFSGVVHPGSRRFITPARRSLPWCCLDFVCLPWARTTALLNRPPSHIPPDAGRGRTCDSARKRRSKPDLVVRRGSYSRRALLLRAMWRSREGSSHRTGRPAVLPPLESHGLPAHRL